jgi:transposase-like protein
MTEDDICGVETASTDGICQNPSGENGFCWIPSHNPDNDNDNPQGRPRESAPSKSEQEQIASVIEAGGSIREACRRAGVHREQVNRWMEYGADDPESVYGEFRDRLVRARGEGEAKYRKALLTIAEENDDTATLMAMLKQRYPDSWGDVDRGEQSGSVVVNVDAEKTTEIDSETLEVQNE